MARIRLSTAIELLGLPVNAKVIIKKEDDDRYIRTESALLLIHFDANNTYVTHIGAYHHDYGVAPILEIEGLDPEKTIQMNGFEYD